MNKTKYNKLYKKKIKNIIKNTKNNFLSLKEINFNLFFKKIDIFCNKVFKLRKKSKIKKKMIFFLKSFIYS